MHGSRGLPWAVFAVIKPGSFIGAGQKRSSEDLQLRKDNLKASLSPIFIVQLPIAWGAVVVATSGSLMNSKTHEFVELSTALFSWAYTPPMAPANICERLAWGCFFFPRFLDPERLKCRYLTLNFRSRRLHVSCWRCSCAFMLMLKQDVSDSWKGTI